MKSSEVAFRRIGSDAELLSPENSDRPAAPCWTHNKTITRFAYPVELARVQANDPTYVAWRERACIPGVARWWRRAWTTTPWPRTRGQRGSRQDDDASQQAGAYIRMSWRIGGCARLWCAGPRTEIVRSAHSGRDQISDSTPDEWLSMAALLLDRFVAIFPGPPLSCYDLCDLCVPVASLRFSSPHTRSTGSLRARPTLLRCGAGSGSILVTDRQGAGRAAPVLKRSSESNVMLMDIRSRCARGCTSFR